MSEEYYDRLIEAIRNWCRENNFHEVCFECEKKCIEPYSPWSGQMPPLIFCEDYKTII